jgi:hypothetical protein
MPVGEISMNTPWIMFYNHANNGEVVIDVCIKLVIDTNTYNEYYITPRYGKVSAHDVIEVREPSKEK